MTQCPICAEEILAGQEVVRPNPNTCTKHLIHRDCEELIPADMKKCPVCRAPFTRFVMAPALTQAEIDEEAEAERRAAALLPTTLPPELEARIQARHGGRAAEEAEHAERVEQTRLEEEAEQEAARLLQEEFDRRQAEIVEQARREREAAEEAERRLTWTRILREFPDENVNRMTDPRDVLVFLKSALKRSSYVESVFITVAEMASILPPSLTTIERNAVFDIVDLLNSHHKPKMNECIYKLKQYAQRLNVFNERISKALKTFNKSYEEVVKTYRFLTKVLDGHHELLMPVINGNILDVTAYTENVEDTVEENAAWLAARRGFFIKYRRYIPHGSIFSENNFVIISQFPFPIRMALFNRENQKLYKAIDQIVLQESDDATVRQVRPRLN